MTNLRSLGRAPLAVALLLFSLALTTLSPAFGSGQASVSTAVYSAADWQNWAITAWKYYTPGMGVNSATGLHKATLAWTCFTDWDLGSYIYAIIYARKLNLITETGSWQFQDRIGKVLAFLQARPLGANNAPYLAYRWDVSSGQYCGDTGTALSNPWDNGRLLAALNALKVFRSTYTSTVDAIVARSKSKIDVWATQTGSNYYSYQAAEGYAAFGYDESTVFSNIDNYADSRGYVSVYGQNLPKISNTLAEPLIHVVLESDLTLKHSPTPKFLDFANRVYLAQSGRYSNTGKLTAWSEGSYVAPHPYIYELIIPRDFSKTWVIGDPDGNPYLGVTPLAYAKVAFAYLAIYGENTYTLALINAAKNLASSQGFGEAVLESGSSAIDIWGSNTNGFYSDKTNEFVLAAASRALSLPTTPDFSVSSNPQTLGVPLGSSVTSTITVSSMNGFSSAVTLSGSWVGSSPSGVTYDFSPNQVTPPSGGSGSSTLTITVGSTASSGSFQLRVTGTSGSLSHTCDMSITISGLTTATTTSSQTTESTTSSQTTQSTTSSQTTQSTTSSQTTQTTTTSAVTFTTTIETTVTNQGSELRLQVLSNSTITNLVYDSERRLLNFTVSGPENTSGLTSLTIAKGLLDGVPVVFVDGAATGANVSEDLTYYYVRFSYAQSSHDVTVAGSNTIAEMPSAVVALVSILVMATLISGASVRKSKSKTRLQHLELFTFVAGS